MILIDATAGRTVVDAIKVVPIEIETQMVAADAIKLVANDAEDDRRLLRSGQGRRLHTLQ